MQVYRQVKSVPGLEVTADAEFRYNGKPKKVIYCHTVNGRKATARITIRYEGKNHYWQAAKLVAEAWKVGYNDDDYITYKDGDIHNICVDNLVIEDKKGYYKYMQRNSGYKADNVEERKRKLQLVADEALMTKHYFEIAKQRIDNELIQPTLF